MFFEETLAMYGVGGGEWDVCAIQDSDRIFTRFRFISLKTCLSRTRFLKN